MITSWLLLFNRYKDSFDDIQSIQLSTLVNEQQEYEELETPTSENIN